MYICVMEPGCSIPFGILRKYISMLIKQDCRNARIIPIFIKQHDNTYPCQIKEFLELQFFRKIVFEEELVECNFTSENYFVAYISFFYDSMLCMPVLFFSILIQINAIILLNGIKTS